MENDDQIRRLTPEEKAYKNAAESGPPELVVQGEPWRNLQTILNMFRNVPGAQITIFNLNGFPNGVTADCQDEPHLIATDSDEADAILDMWGNGK